VLLTFFDMSARTHYLNARQTLATLLAWRVLPVINENDTTATDEISFGDNDFLAAQVAVLIGAEQLILLTDIEGLFTGTTWSWTDGLHHGVRMRPHVWIGGDNSACRPYGCMCRRSHVGLVETGRVLTVGVAHAGLCLSDGCDDDDHRDDHHHYHGR
jgi:hypothetical protein